MNLVSGSIAFRVRAGQATERRWESGARLAVRPRLPRGTVWKRRELRLEPRNYAVEIVLPGFVPLRFDVQITPGRTTTYRGYLLPE